MSLDYYKERNKLISINLLLSRFRSSRNIRTFQTYKSSNVIYEDGKSYGSISYEDVDKRVRFVTFKSEEKVFKRFVIKCDEYIQESIESKEKFKIVEYKDLETGSTIYNKKVVIDNEGEEISQEENLMILNEQSVVPCLCLDNFVKADYEINQFVCYCFENALHMLTSDEEEFKRG